MNESRSKFKSLAWISYILSGIFISLGFYKMFIYSNPESPFAIGVNAYVGGDAYNYIINANYATAYFALAIFCAVIGMTAVIGYLLTSKEANQIVTEETAVEIVKSEELF